MIFMAKKSKRIILRLITELIWMSTTIQPLQHYTPLYSTIHGYTALHPCTVLYTPLQHYTPLYSTIHGYTALHPCTVLYTPLQHYTPLYSTIHGYTALHPCTVLYTPIKHYTALYTPLQHYTPAIQHYTPLYYIDTSVLLGTKPLVDSIRHCIRDPSGVFSVWHLCECRIVQWRHNSRFLFLLNWLNLSVYDRNIFGSSSVVFDNLRQSSVIFGNVR